MIEITKDDVIYKVPASARSFEEVLKDIPENATVLDANDCCDFASLNKLAERPSLEVLLLKNTAVNGRTLSNLTKNILYIDIRGCDIASYGQLGKRAKETPELVVFSNFVGERILATLPDGIDYQIDGSVFSRPKVVKRRQVNIPLIENQKVYA